MLQRGLLQIPLGNFSISTCFAPPRSSDKLPAFVRTLHVPNFKGYTTRYAILDDGLYLLAAFAPGLSDATKDRHTKAVLKDLA